jgi:hypothetical protein
MASVLKSRALLNRVIDGLEIIHNPECYLGAIDMVLRLRGDVAGRLINHQLGFCYWPAMTQQDTPTIAAFGRGEAERLLQQVSGISIRWNTARDWEHLLEAAGTSLNNDQPLILFVDTFFLPHFSKRKGHLPHALIIYGYDSRSDSFLLKSTVPDDWNMRVADLRPACQSKIIPGGAPITWVDIQFPAGNNRTVTTHELLLNTVFNMRNAIQTPAAMAGMFALNSFACDFSTGSWTADQFSYVCQSLGKMVPTIVHQRRRFALFLANEMSSADGLCRTYEHLALQWEIFANACLKVQFCETSNLRERMIVRLQSLAAKEESALELVETKARAMKTECIQGS